MPRPATPNDATPTVHGTSGRRTRSIPASPLMVTANPTRTNCRVGQRLAPRAWIQAPAVQAIVAAVSAIPAWVADRPRQPTSVSDTNASTPKKAQVRMPRSRIAAGSTGRARSVPAGVRRRSARTPMMTPAALSATVTTGCPLVSPTVSRPAPNATVSASGSRVAVGGRRAMLVDAGRHGDRVERTERQRAGQRDERQQPQEHEPPADRFADGAGERRADDTGQDPGGRQRGEHARPERLGQRPSDRHVGDRLDRAGAQALDEPGTHQHRHRRCEATDEQADREQAEPGRERDRQSTPVDRTADDDDADQRAEEERREHPAVQLEPAKPAELVGDDRHDGRDRERFEADQRDGQDEADGQGASIGAPQAADRVNPGMVHAPSMARRPPMRHGRPSTAGGRRSSSVRRSRPGSHRRATGAGTGTVGS